MTFSEMMHRYDMASLQQAKAEGHAGRWWVLWFLKKSILLILKLIFIVPVQFFWQWTGRKNTGLFHFVECAFFSFLYYCILYVLITAPFHSHSHSESESAPGISVPTESGK